MLVVMYILPPLRHIKSTCFKQFRVMSQVKVFNCEKRFRESAHGNVVPRLPSNEIKYLNTVGGRAIEYRRVNVKGKEVLGLYLGKRTTTVGSYKISLLALKKK